MRVAAVGDIHFGRTSQGSLRGLLERVNDEADVLLLPGDLTDFGLAEEGEMLAGEIRAVLRVPTIAVLGNHDFESGQADAIAAALKNVGVVVLDGDACEIDSVGFAGTKGFAGGFGRGSLGPWGEPIIKAFVQEAVNEAMKLESALARLRTERKVVLLHYSPIEHTISREPREIFAYMGSSRLEEPLVKYPPDVVVHGHAHRGEAEGRTSAGTPVYNVSLPLLRDQDGHGRLFRLIEL